MKDYNFGNFICMLRENKGMTQQELADILGITPAAVSKWENGSSKPRVEVLFQLAKILDVRPDELMAGRFLTEEVISAEAVKGINERYEYLSKIESYASTSVKLKRLLSSVIDFSVALALAWIVTLLVYELVTAIGVDSGTESIACILSLMLSFDLFFGLRDFLSFGRSVGKRIMRLIVLDKKTGQEASRTQKFFQNFFTVVLIFITTPLLLVDVIIMLIRGQSIGDSVANTVVVEAEPHEKDTNRKEDRNESHIPSTKKKGGSIESSNTPLLSVDFQKINAYTPHPGPSRRFIIGFFCVIAIIMITAIGLLAIYFTNYDSYEIVNTDIAKYEEDRATYCNASDFMPELASLTQYTDIFYSHKTTIDSRFMGFVCDGLALFVQYDASVYEIKKAELLNSYTFLDTPVFDGDDYQLPVTDLFYKNYDMKIVPDKEYQDFCACKSFALIGFDDENKSIVYCYHYDFDLDYIAEKDEDLEAEMCKFMNHVFEWIVLPYNSEG